jgi:(S)-3,5-dihydroxyphenylglycine transaminase
MAFPAVTLRDYERLAREHMDPVVWDFIAGGSGDERSLVANSEAFDRVRLLPRILTGAEEPDLTTPILGRTWAAPIGVAPMAYHTMVHPDGEVATALAASEIGVPFVVSTFAGRTIEEVAAVAEAPLWLQVYCFRDQSITRDLVARAEQAGVEALVVTADAPRLGRRVRDLRNGFRLPPGISPANLPSSDFSSPQAHARAELDPNLDWSVITWLRSVSTLPVLVKGILTAGDAVRAVEAGVDGIVVSNHGGRQLDGVPATFEVLPLITAAVAGRCAVLLDGGVRRGTDTVAAMAFGADAVLIGRPLLHGLAVGGREGACHVLEIIRDELCDAMALIGAASSADLGPDRLYIGEHAYRR